MTEDEAALRTLAAEVLAKAGFTVVEAAHADDALAIMKSRAVDMLFADVQMPGSMDGLELARYVRRHWPRVAADCIGQQRTFFNRDAGRKPIFAQPV